MVFLLANDIASVSVDAMQGGRVASLKILNREVLITQKTHDSMLGWGCFPMAPYAGRVRSGRVQFNNCEYQLPLTLPPHAAHGTVFNQSWEITSTTESSVELFTELGQQWPFGGAVSHRIELTENGIHMNLCVTAGDHYMPVQVGWHPWFHKASSACLKFASMLKRDKFGIATSQRINSDAVNVDDCFLEPLEVLSLNVNQIELALSSNCSHWVVYDLPTDSICVEPQSGAPNEINDAPVIIGPNESLTRWFDIAWTGRINQ